MLTGNCTFLHALVAFPAKILFADCDMHHSCCHTLLPSSHMLTKACRCVKCRLSEYKAALRGYNAIVQSKEEGHGVACAIFYKKRFRLWWADHRSRAIIAALLYVDSAGETQVCAHRGLVQLHHPWPAYLDQRRLDRLCLRIRALTHREHTGGKSLNKPCGLQPGGVTST